MSKYQNTTRYSERDINKKFNQIEFNKVFEQENLNFNNNLNNIECSKKYNLNFLLVIICIIMIGILLLLFNNFILHDSNNK